MEEKLILRESTGEIIIETTYCRSCGFNHLSNIGSDECVNCKKIK